MTTCVYCHASAAQRHHPTGRGADGGYLDPELRVPVCVPCHAVDHQLWRHFGLDTADDHVLARLGRLAFLVGRLGDLERPVALAPDFWLGLRTLLLDLESIWGSR